MKSRFLKKFETEKLDENGNLQDQNVIQPTKLIILSSIAGSHSLYSTREMTQSVPEKLKTNLGYRMSKSACNMGCQILAHELKQLNVVVGSIHPGFVDTTLTARFPNFIEGLGHKISVEESVDKCLNVIDHIGYQNTGYFWHCDGYHAAW